MNIALKKEITEILENAFVLVVSFTMSAYGFAKLVQFKNSYDFNSNKLVSELSGMQLMWTFYDYSYNFTLLIGFFEILGAVLIFFRKTRIIGCIFTTFILTNIIIQDFAFGVKAVFSAIWYQILILAILWFHRQKLITIFKQILIKNSRIINLKKKLILFSASILVFILLKWIEISSF
ncbi:hypothetical protein [Aureivirga sp. CE67]|uniref:hypothetical protein n=1 Tax=Aureivirga sp. CE67 TaxID=1788983 RepID=UPI0018CAB3BD|nr:hypothetical protein [Aureivirga sp. CE67]